MRPAELNQIQRWMQAVITHPGGVAEGAVSAAADAMISNATEQVEQIIRPSRKQTAAERLQVYSNAYFARLLDCLREEYPALRHAAGEDAFEGFAIGYLQQHPSQSYTLADLGAGFPGYLADPRPPFLLQTYRLARVRRLHKTLPRPRPGRRDYERTGRSF
jgi:hypothetical protein